MPVDEKEAVVIQPWGIEACHPRMCDLLLQCIPGEKLRSEMAANKTAKDQKTGREMIPQDQAAGMAMMPQVPGMQLHVNPAKLTYMILDPLEDNEELCDRIKQAIDNSGGTRGTGKLRGVPVKRGTLDQHRMKSLQREMLWLLQAGEARVCKGAQPKMEDVDRMPGRYLLNPGSRVPNMQPVFQDQWDDYYNNLQKAGG